jgi:alkyldihydroxyacetonephosphate synthase
MEKDFVRNDDYSRLSVAYGKTMYDLLRLRQKKIENIPDVVVYPDTKEQIEKTVAYCEAHKIPLYVYGGGSSVTRGVECMKGGISHGYALRYNKVLASTKSIRPSPSKPACRDPLRKDLNNAVKTLHAKRAYTCGHFPQSFEYSRASAAGSSPAAPVKIPLTMARSRISSSLRNTPLRSA